MAGTVKTIEKTVVEPFTEPLTSSAPDFSTFVIGGILEEPLNAVVSKTPLSGHKITTGAIEVIGGYALSRYGKGVKNKVAKKVIGGGEVTLAVTGSHNIVAGVRDIIISRKAGTKIKQTVTQRWF